MTGKVYGSLVISATTPVKDFEVFNHARTKTGNHTESKYRGLYSLLIDEYNLVENNVALPQRNKYMVTSVVGSSPTTIRNISQVMARSLTDLDSRFDGARQLFKMQQLMSEIEIGTGGTGYPYLAVINNISEHASFNILSSKVQIHVFGVYDTVNKSVRLVWTTDDEFIAREKESDYTRYVFYRFPVLYDRPLFIYTQSVCAKWFSWSNAFTESDGVLKTFNALENFLYKDPSLAQLETKR